MFEGIMTDVRIAIRGLRRTPGFTASAIGVLALGIGANATVFSALETAVLAPIEYPDPDRLVFVDMLSSDPRSEESLIPWSYPKFQAYLGDAERVVDPVAGFASRTVTLTDVGPPDRVGIEVVTPAYFDVLGRQPVLGRGFTAEENDPEAPPLAAVLSHELWTARLGADPEAVGRTVRVNGKPVVVVGVAPAGFKGLTGSATLWLPMAAAGELISPFMVRGTQAHWLHAVGRLRGGSTFSEAGARVAAFGARIDELFPPTEPGESYGATLRSFADVRVNEDARSAVLLFTGAAALVLLVACANLSGLLLARARRRSADSAVRLSVGASRWRLGRASLVESGLLAGIGGLVGLGLAVWGTRVVSAVWPSEFLTSGGGELRATDPTTLGVDATVLVFAVLLTAGATLLFGVGPAVRASSAELADRLRGGTGPTRRMGSRSVLDGRSALVGAQIALALVLLIGAGLVGGSVKRLLDVEEGFDPSNLLTFDYAIPGSSSWSQDPVAFHVDFLDRLRALPEIESATVGCPPLRGHCWITLVQAVEGQPEIPPGEGPRIGVHMVGDRHFDAMGIPMLRGRQLDERDGTDPTPTMVISELAAGEIFGDEDPIGRRIRIGVSEEGKEDFAEIVGVAGDVVYGRPDEDVIPEAYFSFREFGDRSAAITVRTRGEPMDVVPAIRRELANLDPTLPVYRIATMDELVARSTWDRRLVLALLGMFAALTVLLAATGTWAIVSYSVADRRHELGLRMALGARAGWIVGLVLRESVRIGVIGVAGGLAGAWAGARLLEAFLYETSATDPWAFGGAALLLLGVVLISSWVPARRVAGVDPSEALRAE